MSRPDNRVIVFSVSAASVGGLSGSGNVNLGTTVLTVGANNANSDYSGLAQRRQRPDQDRQRHVRPDRDEHLRRAHGHRRGHAATGQRNCRLRRQYAGSAAKATARGNSICRRIPTTAITGGALTADGQRGRRGPKRVLQYGGPRGRVQREFRLPGRRQQGGRRRDLHAAERSTRTRRSRVHGGALDTAPATAAGDRQQRRHWHEYLCRRISSAMAPAPASTSFRAAQSSVRPPRPATCSSGSGDPIQVNVSYDGSNVPFGNVPRSLHRHRLSARATTLAVWPRHRRQHRLRRLLRRRRRINVHADDRQLQLSYSSGRSAISCPPRRPFRSPPAPRSTWPETTRRSARSRARAR